MAMNDGASWQLAWHLLSSADPALWGIIWLSLKTACLSLFLAAPLATLLGYGLAHRHFYGQRWLLWLVQTSLSLPTVLIGLMLYLLLSRAGPLGSWHWLFTQTGIVAGQVLLALPVLTALTVSAVQAADPRLAETAQTLGAGRWRIMMTVLVEVRFGLAAAWISGFGRVLSEVGCALMVGGNIAGQTRTITTAIALETSKGEFAQGMALGMVLIVLALLMNAAFLLLQGDIRAAAAKA